MLNITIVILTFIYIYCLSFTIGFFLFNFDSVTKFYLGITLLPIVAVTGLCTLILLSYTISFVVIHWSVLITPLILIAPIILFNSLRKGVKLVIKISIKTFSRTIAMVMLNIIPLIYFTLATDVMKWPPPGDIIGHGLQVSLLRHNGKILLTFEPLSPYANYYPRGFHIFVANVAELMGLYSGEAVLIMGAFLSALTPSLLFSLTYMLTDSFFLSLMPYLASFHIHSTENLGRWVFGYFFNGVYPCFTGIVSYILLTSLLVLFRKTNSRKILYITILILAELFFTYPDFFITVAPISLLIIGKPLWQIAKKSKWVILIFATLSIPAVMTILTIGRHYIGKLLTTGFSPSFRIPSVYFSDWTTLSIFLAAPMGIYLLVKKRQISVPTIFLTTLLLNVISMSDEAYRFLCIILPTRLIIVDWMLSWVIISSFMATVLKYIKNLVDNKHRCFKLIVYKQYLTTFTLGDTGAFMLKLACILLVLCIFYPSLYLHFSLNRASRAAWYTRSSSFPFDYNVSLWVSQNVPSDELILNDMSYSGLYLPSFTFKKVVFHYFSHPSEYNEARLIWLRPEDQTLVMEILRKLEIKWIVITSEWGYLDLWMYGGSGKYIGKPFKPNKYIEIFDSYPFLKKMYQYGNSTVYKVLL